MPWKLPVTVAGSDRAPRCCDARHGVAERHARPEVERQRHRRQLAGVVDLTAARRTGLYRCDLRERYQPIPPAPRTSQHRQRVRIALKLRRDLHDRPDTRCSARRSSRPAASRRRAGERRSTWSTVRPSAAMRSRSSETFTCGLVICRSLVTSTRPGSWRTCCLELGRDPIQLLGVGILQRMLIQASRLNAADPDRRRVLQIDADARHCRQLRPQLARSLRPRSTCRSRARLQLDVQTAGVAVVHVVGQRARRSGRR